MKGTVHPKPPLRSKTKEVATRQEMAPAREQTKRPETTLAVLSHPNTYSAVFSDGYRLEKVSLTPQARAEIDAVLAEVAQLPERIAQDSDEPAHIDTLARVKDQKAKLEGARETLKAPFLGACKLIDACAKEARALLEAPEQRISGELARVEGVRRRQAMEEQRRLEEEVTKNYLAAQRAVSGKRKAEFYEAGALAQREAAEAVKPTEGLSVRLGWRAELVDAATVIATNPQLLAVSVRQSSVNDLIRSLEERRETIGPDSIPGIRLYPITSIGVRKQKNE